MSERMQPRSIPVGILVPPSRKKQPGPCRKPSNPKPVVRPQRVERQRRFPWVGVALAGVGAWTVLVGVLACYGIAKRELPAGRAPLVAHSAPAVAESAVTQATSVAVTPSPAPPAVELGHSRAVANPIAAEPKSEVPVVTDLVSAEPTCELPPKPQSVQPAAPLAVCAANLGTSIRFVADPTEAFKQAKQENKLVFMMNLSGNFEDKGFT